MGYVLKTPTKVIENIFYFLIWFIRLQQNDSIYYIITCFLFYKLLVTY